MNSVKIEIPCDTFYDYIGETLRDHLEAVVLDDANNDKVDVYVTFNDTDSLYSVARHYSYQFDGNVDYVSESLRDVLENELESHYRLGHSATVVFCY